MPIKGCDARTNRVNARRDPQATLNASNHRPLIRRHDTMELKGGNTGEHGLEGVQGPLTELENRQKNTDDLMTW